LPPVASHPSARGCSVTSCSPVARPSSPEGACVGQHHMRIAFGSSWFVRCLRSWWGGRRARVGRSAEIIGRRRAGSSRSSTRQSASVTRSPTVQTNRPSASTSQPLSKARAECSSSTLSVANPGPPACVCTACSSDHATRCGLPSCRLRAACGWGRPERHGAVPSCHITSDPPRRFGDPSSSEAAIGDALPGDPSGRGGRRCWPGASRQSAATRPARHR
jgi:hypothetical protein